VGHQQTVVIVTLWTSGSILTTLSVTLLENSRGYLSTFGRKFDAV